MRQPPTLLPDDTHNRALLQNVHPPGWRNPEPARRYNLVVIGAGTAGLVTAAGAAGLGARVALVERHLLGGDCLNVGCVPSKTVIRSSRVVAELREAKALGVKVPDGVAVDFGAVMERMRRVRAEISPHDSAWRFSRDLGVDVFLGEAAFSGPDAVVVDGCAAPLRQGRRRDRIASQPPADPGSRRGGVPHQRDGLRAHGAAGSSGGGGRWPDRMRAGPGIPPPGRGGDAPERCPQLLPRDDPEAAEIVRQGLLRDGVRLALGAAIVDVTRVGGRKVLRYRESGREDAVAADEILVATGRVPNVEGLGLETAGVSSAPEGIVVDDHLRTTNARIYAAGDVCLGWKFTHAADAAARIVIQNALFGLVGRRRLSRLVVPWCTYTDPEVAHVGLGEREARERGVAIDTLVRRLAEVDRARTDGETEGFVKVHVRRGTDRIVGATIVARRAGELISELTLAMSAGVGLGRLSGVIHPYPTQSEAIRQLGDQYRRTRLTPFVRRALGTWLRWTR